MATFYHQYINIHPVCTDFAAQVGRKGSGQPVQSSQQIPGVTKYLPRGLQYGSGQVIHGFLCLKCRKFST